MDVSSDLSGEINCLEHPLLKVPYEELSKTFRSLQRLVERDITAVTSELTALQRQAALPTLHLTTRLDTLKHRLVTARDKLKELIKTEKEIFSRSEIRFNHLASAKGNGDSSAQGTAKEVEWKRIRLDRILIDHFLREGQYETAAALARDSEIEPLVNIPLFLTSREIETSLQQRDCTLALRWCEENADRLNKLKSTFKFKLHLQEYVELVRRGERMEAIAYAKKHLSNCADRHLSEIQAAMSLLIFTPETNKFQKYQILYDDERWEDLIAQFRRNNFVLNSLTAQSPLSITLQAGLAALKTPNCFEEGNRNKNCPVCQDDMNQLAEALPFAHHVNSCLVCRISGAIMNEDNPPMMLPNGNVYGYNALMDLLHNTGKITCPRSQQVFGLADLKKVYVM